MKKSTKTAIIIAVAVIGGAAVIGAVTGQSSQKSTSETSGTSTSSVASVSSNVKSNDDNNTEISLESSTLVESSVSAESNVSEEPSDVDVSTVVYDKNGIKITYKGLENQYGITTSIKFLLENSNSEKYTVQTTDISIDGFTYSTIMSTSIAANKKASDSVVILDSDFKENGTSYEKIKTAEIGLVIWGESNILDQTKDTVTFTIQ